MERKIYYFLLVYFYSVKAIAYWNQITGIIEPYRFLEDVRDGGDGETYEGGGPVIQGG